MNKSLKITKIGNSAGTVLAKDVLARLWVGPGQLRGRNTKLPIQ